jgi:hypothetical protein
MVSIRCLPALARELRREGLWQESEAMVAAIEAGDQEPRRRFIENMFLPTSDRRLVDDVLAMMAAPSHAAASAMRGGLAFDGPAVAAQC